MALLQHGLERLDDDGVGAPAPVQRQPELVTQVAAALQLEELSKVLQEMNADLKALKEENATLKSTLATLTQADEVKQAKAASALPRMSWMRASQAQETIIGDKVAGAVRPAQGIPKTVKALASTMDGAV